MSKKHFGKCAICGRECELTFEHIPPRSAFNSHPAKIIQGVNYFGRDNKPWDLTGLPYLNRQQGVGRYSLCSDCNNNTGTWYGNEYHRMVEVSTTALSEKSRQIVSGFSIEQFYPLRFIKQVISMFCSLNPDDQSMNDLRNFVINKESVCIDKSHYKICMYFSSSRLGKQVGKTVILRMGIGSIALSEIVAFPLGFILYYNPNDKWDYKGIDITKFGDFHYNDCCEVKIPLMCYEVNSFIPEDTRTKSEIEECINEAQKWKLEHENDTD